MRRRWAVGGTVVLVVAVAGGVALAGALGGGAPKVTYLTATARVGDVVSTVSVTGSVQPVETYALAFGQAPVRNPKASSASGVGTPSAQQWTVDSVRVRAGDQVTAGQVLARADPADAEAALTTARLNLEAARARLALDAAPVTANAKARAKLAITQASRQLSQARTAQAQAAATGRLAVAQAEAVVADAQAKLADDQAASLPATVTSADGAAVKQAQWALAAARQQASGANSQAAAAVQNAQLGVQSAQLAYDGTTAVNTDAAVAADRVAVAQAETAVSNAQTTLDRLTLTAPIAGIVSSVAIQPGDVVSGTVIVLRGAALEVVASVTEADLPAVRPGQPADVAIGALGVSAKGAVTEVDVANATKSASGVVSYSVTVSLPSAPERTAPSMTADVAITTATAAGVLWVPTSAVGGAAGAYTVQVLDSPGKTHAVAVGVGLMTPAQAAITSGLAAGTTVVTGVVTAKDLVTTFPTGPGGGTPAPAATGQ